uniref:Uncharacterized protein n=1 Tax=viral metagenome TaxID=1070528 RepID=A0A6C0HZR5_9ZZZZ
MSYTVLPTDISSNFSHVIVAVEPPIEPVTNKQTKIEPIGLLEIKTPIMPILQEIATQQIDTFITALVPSSSKFSVNLTQQEIAVITALVNDASGTLLPQIKTTIEGLLQEGGKLSLHDIPQLVLLITQLFQSNIFAVKNINLLNVIKYTLDSLLDSNILPIPSGVESLAKTIVDTSIELLNTTLPTVEEECWTIWNYLSACFTKK